MRRACGRGLSRASRALRDTNGIRWRTFSSNTMPFGPPSFCSGIRVSESLCREKPPDNTFATKTITRRPDGITADVSDCHRNESSPYAGFAKCSLRQPIAPAPSAALGSTNGRWFTAPKLSAMLNGRYASALEKIADLVESLGPRCTHYDAFRFFTPAARPLNRYQPTRGNRSRPRTACLPACKHGSLQMGLQTRALYRLRTDRGLL